MAPIGTPISAPQLGVFFLASFLWPPFQGVLGARFRQAPNCGFTDSVTPVDSLEELTGFWYISGISYLHLDPEQFTMSCFSWNVTDSYKKVLVNETLTMGGSGKSFNQINVFSIDQKTDGSYTIRKPNWGTNQATDKTTIGIVENRAVIVKCNEGSKPRIVALSRDRNDLLNETLALFDLPTSLDFYVEFEQLQQEMCDPSQIPETTTAMPVTTTDVPVTTTDISETTTGMSGTVSDIEIQINSDNSTVLIDDSTAITNVINNQTAIDATIPEHDHGTNQPTPSPTTPVPTAPEPEPSIDMVCASQK